MLAEALTVYHHCSHLSAAPCLYMRPTWASSGVRKVVLLCVNRYISFTTQHEPALCATQ